MIGGRRYISVAHHAITISVLAGLSRKSPHVPTAIGPYSSSPDGEALVDARSVGRVSSWLPLFTWSPPSAFAVALDVEGDREVQARQSEERRRRAESYGGKAGNEQASSIVAGGGGALNALLEKLRTDDKPNAESDVKDILARTDKLVTTTGKTTAGQGQKSILDTLVREIQSQLQDMTGKRGNDAGDGNAVPDQKAKENTAQRNFAEKRQDESSERAQAKTRRRMLYELSIRSHYDALLQHHAGIEDEDEDEDDEIDDAKSQWEPGLLGTVIVDVDQGLYDVDKDSGDSTPCAFYNPPPSQPANDSLGDPDEISDWSYWSYRLCREVTIEQFHLTSKGRDASTESELVFAPSSVYNLGYYFDQAILPKDIYVSTVRTEWGPDEPTHDINSESVQYYINGDVCVVHAGEGTRGNSGSLQRRTTKVIAQDECCTSYETLEEADEEAIRRLFQPSDMRILSVDEPSPCRYEMHVCSVCESDSNKDKQEDDDPPSNTEEVDGSTKHDDRAMDDTVTSQCEAESFESTFDAQRLLDVYMGEFSDFDTDKHSSHSTNAFPPMPFSKIKTNLDSLRSMFMHSYDSYMYRAFPASELKPISCRPGTFNLVRIPALTLIDILDNFIIMGNYTEFARSVERLRELDAEMRLQFQKTFADTDSSGLGRGGLFAVDQNVSVFETNIRVLGGLLSAHQLAESFMDGRVLKEDVRDSDGEVRFGRPCRDNYPPSIEKTDQDEKSCEASLEDPYEECDTAFSLGENSNECIALGLAGRLSKASVSPLDYWSYDGFLLTLAHDIGQRLLAAFQTPTGIPYGTVNLLRGIPPGETPIASLAGGGTLTLEMELLSRLTGDSSFGNAAKLATRALWLRRSASLSLLGKHIDVNSGKWTEVLSGIGSNSDSFYEYLIKHYILFPDDDDFWTMFMNVYTGVHRHSRLGAWYADVDMGGGLTDGGVRQVFESLMAFYPGMQTLQGELSPAARTLNSFFLVREFLGLLPERFHYGRWNVDGRHGVHPLRPELLESCYFLHLATIGLQMKDIDSDSSGRSRPSTSGWLWAADFALHTLHSLTHARCGYATVKAVSPRTTGSIASDLLHFDSPPKEQQARHGVKLQDEMPSYFLSETIKYLYLMFDEDNILHTDKENEWIFTTEAHPIHHVSLKTVKERGVGGGRRPSRSAKPEDTQSGKDRIDIQRDKVISLLRDRVATSTKNRYGEKTPLTDGALKLLFNSTTQQWSAGTPADEYTKHIHVVLNESLTQKNRSFYERGAIRGPLFRRPEPSSGDTDVFSVEDFNIAYLSFDHMGKGDGYGLFKSCPNYHHPRLKWVHALSGESLDYSERFVSSLVDEVPVGDEMDLSMLSALAASCFYGTNYFAEGQLDEGLNMCASTEDAKKAASLRGSKKDRLEKQQSSSPSPGSQRFDMGGELGLFDVASFADGEGFSVRHVASGEQIEVTFFRDVTNVDHTSTDTILIIDTIPPPPVASDSSPATGTEGALGATGRRSVASTFTSWKPSGEKLKSVISGSSDGDRVNEEDAEKDRVTASEKYVVMADMDDHSFMCDVVLTTRPEERKGVPTPDQMGGVVAKFPCSAAFFGPTIVQRLVESQGIKLTSELRPPMLDDEMGCESGSSGAGEMNSADELLAKDEARESGIAQMVRRGGCTFQRKTWNQRQRYNAEAVIVINSEDEQLFVMASDKVATKGDDGKIIGDHLNEKESPVSVLVSKNDGKEMIKVMEDAKKQKTGKIYATVRLRPQPSEKVESSSTQWWPMVHSTKEVVQIFAAGGWGIHAVRLGQKQSEAEDGDHGWQMFIMQHNNGKRP